MSKKSKLHLRVKELSIKDSVQAVKELLKRKRLLQGKDLKPGHLIFTFYDAKYKENTYDKTPLVLILRRNSSHTLGLNFHWIPYSMRIYLIRHIIEKNAANIRQRKPLKFKYSDVKPMLKSLGYAPCIRLYINSRFSQTGVVLPSHQLMSVARLKAETFTQGKYSAPQLFAMARAKSRSKK